METKVTFIYCEESHKWEVYVTGVVNVTEALQAFCAVLLTTEQANPSIFTNRATPVAGQPNTYKISVGV